MAPDEVDRHTTIHNREGDMRETGRQPDQEIREKAYIIVEELIQLYKMTDPRFRQKTEDD
jgi:hypothetical protein